MAGANHQFNVPSQAWSTPFSAIPTPVTPSTGSSVRAPEGEPPTAVLEARLDSGAVSNRKSQKQRASVLDASRKLRLTKLTKVGQKPAEVTGTRLRPIGSAMEGRGSHRSSGQGHRTSSASRGSWTSFGGGLFPRRISVENPCRSGMHEIIEHVHLDSDGGLSNLDNEHQTFDSEQITKIPVIRKKGMQLVLAAISVFRAVGNTGYILWASTSTSARYFYDAEDMRSMYKAVRVSSQLPLPEVVVAMHFLEFIVVSVLIGRFVWDIFVVFVLMTHEKFTKKSDKMNGEDSMNSVDEDRMTDRDSTPVSQEHNSEQNISGHINVGGWFKGGASENVSSFLANSKGLGAVKKMTTTIFPPEPTGPAATRTHPRYMRLAKIFWKDFPRLQTFSLLRALAYVHPNLIAKHAKDFTMRDRAARIILERFLKKPEDVATDGDLVEAVAEILMEHAHKDVQEEEPRGRLANEYLSLSPYKIVKRLLKSPLVQMGEQELGDAFDCRILKSGWRLPIFLFAEKMCFFALVLSLLTLGSCAFFTKLCLVTVRLTDPESSFHYTLLWCFLFMNQVMSILNTKELLLWRVETLIFGGSDAVVSTEERYIINVYLGSLAEKIWESNVLGSLQRLAIMLQLDDDDLQGLIVEEDHNAKSSVILAVKQYMRDSGEYNPSWVVQWVAPGHGHV